MVDYLKQHHVITTEEAVSAKNHWFSFSILIENIVKNYPSINADTSSKILADIVSSNNQNIKGVALIIEYMLTISISQSPCERANNLRDRIVTEGRCKLSLRAINNIMRIKLETDDPQNSDPKPAIKYFLTACRGSRHIGGHKLKRSTDSTPNQFNSVADTVQWALSPLKEEH